MEDSTTNADDKRPRKPSAKQTPPTPAAPTAARAKRPAPAQKAVPTPTAVPTTTPPANVGTGRGRTGKAVTSKAVTSKAAPRKAATSKAVTGETTTTKAATPKAGPTKAAPAEHAGATPTPTATTPPAKAASKRAIPLRKTAQSPGPNSGSRGTGPKPDRMVSAQLEIALVTSGPAAPQSPEAPPPLEAAPPPAIAAPVASSRPVPLWARLVADPGYAPEHVARAAVRQLGPQAADWVARVRERYPDATADGVARLAARHFTRAAHRQGAATGAAGPVGSLATVGVVAQTQARLVLCIAAAYGLDPRAEARAHDLIMLLRVPRLTEPALAALADAGRPIVAYAVRRVAARVIPFGAAVAGAVHGGRSTEAVAGRAVHRFRRATST